MSDWEGCVVGDWGGGGGVVGLFTSAKCRAWSETVTWGIMNAWNHSFAHRYPFIFSWMVGGPMTETLALMRNMTHHAGPFTLGHLLAGHLGVMKAAIHSMFHHSWEG